MRGLFPMLKVAREFLLRKGSSSGWYLEVLVKRKMRRVQLCEDDDLELSVCAHRGMKGVININFFLIVAIKRN